MNGESAPSWPIKINVGKNKNYVTPFVNLFDVAEKWNKDDGLQITRNVLDQGYAIYTFNFALSNLGEAYSNFVRQGNVRLEVKFASKALSCLAYAEFLVMLEIHPVKGIRYTEDFEYEFETVKSAIKKTATSLGCLKEFLIIISHHRKSINTCPCTYTCYTNPSQIQGQHWVVFWFENWKQTEYFGMLQDSYCAVNSLCLFKKKKKMNADMCIYNHVSTKNESAQTCK